jgi:hypothetical protein
MTNRQEFRVLETFRDFQIREYEPCVIAEVKVSAEFSTASSKAFSSLFGYISQGNRTSEKISMTAPVISAQKPTESGPDTWYVSFVMPAGSKFDQMPDPNDSKVVLRNLDSEVCVASVFRGKASAELSKKIEAQLRAAAGKENLTLSNETRICRFDPPFKPGFLQYNEIVIPVSLPLEKSGL